MRHMPPAARNLFEKRFLDFQKLLLSRFAAVSTRIKQKFLRGNFPQIKAENWDRRTAPPASGQFFQKAPPARRRRRLLIISAVIVVVLFYLFWNCLPEKLFTDPLSPVLFSQEGHLLGARIAADGQWRFPSFGVVPGKYVQALLNFEDKRFYYHPGVDPLALVRALFLNIKSGRRVSGGSTITMQVIRLSRKKKQRTYLEKLKEMILAIRLEIKYSKKEILAFYAAYAPMGGNIVGLEAASRFYFGRSAGELSWAESALLAVLPNSPSLIHPGRNRKLLKEKRDKLLAVLHEKKLIDDLEYSLSVKEPLPGRPRPLPRLAPHLLDTLAREGAAPPPSKGIGIYLTHPVDKNAHFPGEHTSSKKQAAPAPNDGAAFAAHEGTGIYLSRQAASDAPLFLSTIKKNLQQRVTGVCEAHGEKLALRDINNAAALVVDNRTGAVIAYVGNTVAAPGKDNGQAVDIIRRARSTGSILKPLLFAAMLKSGDIAPTTLVADIPTQYGGFMPDNYDRKYRGAVPAKEALSQSLNIPAVRMLQKYGYFRFYDFLKKCGMTTLNRSSDDYGLTLILGGAEGKLYDLVSIYSRLARRAGEEPGLKLSRSDLTKVFGSPETFFQKGFWLIKNFFCNTINIFKKWFWPAGGKYLAYRSWRSLFDYRSAA